MNPKETLSLNNESCLYELPLSESKEKLKYMSKDIVYFMYRTKKNKTPDQVNRLLKIYTCVLLIGLALYLRLGYVYYELFQMRVLVLIAIPLFLYAIFLFSFKLKINYYEHQLFIYLMKKKGKKKDSGRYIQFYDSYAQVIGYSKMHYKDSVFFVKNNDLYMVFFKPGFYIVIEHIEDDLITFLLSKSNQKESEL